MLKINIEIDDISMLTISEKNVLLAITGNLQEAKPLVQKVEIKKDEAKEEPKKVISTKLKKDDPTTKKESVTTESVATPTIKETPLFASTESAIDDVVTPDQLNDYARLNAKPEYGPAYRAILAAHNVKKFKDIDEKDVIVVKAELDKVFTTIV